MKQRTLLEEVGAVLQEADTSNESVTDFCRRQRNRQSDAPLAALAHDDIRLVIVTDHIEPNAAIKDRLTTSCAIAWRLAASPKLEYPGNVHERMLGDTCSDFGESDRRARRVDVRHAATRLTAIHSIGQLHDQQVDQVLLSRDIPT